MEAADADRLIQEISWIRRLALELVRDAAQADDMVQEALLAALERGPTDPGAD